MKVESLQRYTARASGLQAQLALPAAGANLALRPPDFGLTDDDCLLAMVDDGAPVDGEGVVAIPDDDGYSLAVTSSRDNRSLGETSRRIVMQLVERGVYVERNRTASLLDLGTVDNRSLAELVDHGAVRCIPDEFGEMSIALRLESIRLSGAVCVSEPEVVLSIQPRAPFASWGKLEVFQYLLMNGWAEAPEDANVEFYDAGGPKVLPTITKLRPLMHLRVLVLAPSLFLKTGGLRFIYHFGREDYFKLLLK